MQRIAKHKENPEEQVPDRLGFGLRANTLQNERDNHAKQDPRQDRDVHGTLLHCLGNPPSRNSEQVDFVHLPLQETLLRSRLICTSHGKLINEPFVCRTAAEGLLAVCVPIRLQKRAPKPRFGKTRVNCTPQNRQCRVIHVIRRDSFIVEICVYFYGAKALFEWDQTTCSHKFTSDFVIVKPYTA